MSTGFLSSAGRPTAKPAIIFEFLRFSELENGVLFATIHPKDNVLPYLAEHFTDRLPSENFMIYDATHQSVAVHKSAFQLHSHRCRRSGSGESQPVFLR